MLQDIDLRELAEMDAPERSFVSFYGSTEAHPGLIDQQVERIMTMLEDHPEEQDHFVKGMELLQGELSPGIMQDGGVCIFACYALNFVRTYKLSAPVPFTLRIDASPYLKPLARLQDQYEDFLVIATDNQRTRIFHVAASESEMERSIRGDVKNHVRKGGWSQQRYSRRRDNQLARYCEEVAEAIAELVREDEINRIVIVGSKETVSELEDHLPVPIKEKVIGTKRVDLHEGKEHLIQEAYEMFFETERAEEKDLWSSIRREYLSDGLAVMGAEAVLNATLNGQTDTIIVNVGAKLAGSRCPSCENIFVHEPEECHYCGKAQTFALDLVDELTRRAELTRAAVEFVDPPVGGLAKAGHVAALLRYKA